MRFESTDTYVADDDIIAIVNAALVLQRPIVVKGEPGTGKTMLAHAVAESLGRPLLSWHIKSTTRAIDGLYHYDVVQRLNDARFGEGDISDISQYIRLGVLGQAFESEQPAVLLIDEVDKAEVEFPNDLLRELDEMAFHISELDKTITAQHRPLVIITSNAERDLPDAFLRRCLFHYITFPTRERLEQIVDVHMPDLEQELLTVALERFMAFRKLPGLRKPPSTSELLDWLMVLSRGGLDLQQALRSDPFLGVLFKQEHDLRLASDLQRRWL